jgi:hypothetical protein
MGNRFLTPEEVQALSRKCRQSDEQPKLIYQLVREGAFRVHLWLMENKESAPMPVEHWWRMMKCWTLTRELLRAKPLSRERTEIEAKLKELYQP